MATIKHNPPFIIPRIKPLTWNLKVKKSDKRYAGYPQFKYHLDCPTSGETNFFKLREWCWATWGASKSWRDWDSANYKNLFDDTICQNSNWCWIDDGYRHRLLFATKEDVALFKLSTGIS